MENLILADGVDFTKAESPLRHSELMDGTVYVIDLVGFSQITANRIASGARLGTEALTRIVTNLFATLTDELARQDIRFGGFAGDALIAWQPLSSKSLSDDELQALTAEICDTVLSGLSCRTATAQGQFWRADLSMPDQAKCLVWGPAVGAAFSALAAKPRDPARSVAITQSPSIRDERLFATASVSDRWTVVLRALTPQACDAASPDMVADILERTFEICDAFSALIDNIVQDDKGLLLIIVMPPGPKPLIEPCTDLTESLTTGRRPLVSLKDVGSDYGMVFRYRPTIGDQAVTITIGHAINRAAKALVSGRAHGAAKSASAPRSKGAWSHDLVGREDELHTLLQILGTSKTTRQTVAMVGSAGIGKTSLVQQLLKNAVEGSTLVEVTPGSRYLPFGGAQDLAENCGLSARAVFDASGQKALARRLPKTVVIENWQWCDEESKRLFRRLQQDRDTGLLLLTSRADIDDLSADSRIDIAPLSSEQSDQLIERLAPGILPVAMKRSVFEIASGTPFWLVQAALHYASVGKSQPDIAPLSGLESLLGARAQHLSAPAMALWRLYCAWRRPLEFALAQDILANFGIEISVRHLDELQALGWVTPEPGFDGEHVRPAHDILADWGGGDLPVSFERALHSAIARRLSERQESPARIARHWHIAAQDLRAAIWYQRAAISADRAGAHRLTLTHLDQAIALGRKAENQKDIRALEQRALSATAMWGIGRLRRAKQELAKFDRLVDQVKNSQRKRDAVQRAGAIQSEVGQFAGSSKLIIAGVTRGWRARGRGAGAYEVKARREGFIYYALGLLRVPIDGRLKRSISRAYGLSEHRSETVLGCAAGTLYMLRCDWDDAEAVLTSCHNTIAQTDDRQMLGVSQCLLGLCALFQGDTEPALNWFERVAETGREHDHHMFKVWGAYAQAEA